MTRSALLAALLLSVGGASRNLSISFRQIPHG